MNKHSFEAAFRDSKPRQISRAQKCMGTSGNKMSSLSIFERDLWVKGRKFTHPVNVISELNDNIIGFDFICAHNLTYDMLSRQVKFASTTYCGRNITNSLIGHDRNGG